MSKATGQSETKTESCILRFSILNRLGVCSSCFIGVLTTRPIAVFIEIVGAVNAQVFVRKIVRAVHSFIHAYAKQ